VSRYDWLLFLHVLSAFALVASLVLYTVLIASLWGSDVPSEAVRLFRLQRVGDVLVAVGSGGVLVFGIWLAIDVDAYHPWDGWVIAALVLWAVMGALGSRTGKAYNAARDRARALAREGTDAPSPELRALLQDRQALWLHVAGIVTVLVILVDMIFKPGA
jgi:glycerol uptake facilitator-like aquaporin